MWVELLSAFALVLVIEGLLPFLTPDGYRKALLSMLSLHNGQLRFAGLTLMVIGVLLLYFVRN